jgi:hypothetical protein
MKYFERDILVHSSQPSGRCHALRLAIGSRAWRRRRFGGSATSLASYFFTTVVPPPLGVIAHGPEIIASGSASGPGYPWRW